MHLHIRPLRAAEHLPFMLQQDGWHVQPDHSGGLRASHPQALDESAARWRLHQLGLLTSASVQIEFQHVGK